MDDKAKIIASVMLFCSLVLVFKMGFIQLYSEYGEKAQKMTLGKNILYPSRGLIFDRNGKLLVQNKPIYDIEAIYNNVSPDMDTVQFCHLLNIDKQTFIDNLNKDWSSVRYHKASPFTFLSRVNPVQFSYFQEHAHQFPGFYPVVRNIRAYPHKNAAHALGFLGEVTDRDIEKDKLAYSRGDYIGRTGLERQYEQALRGSKGIEYMLKDNLGRKLSSFDNGSLDSSAVAGADLTCSIDLPLQEYGEKLLSGRLGSIVALEPSTGEVLAMVSSASYDPSMLNLDQDRGTNYALLQNDSINKPLFDRSVNAKYPPGSIFKPIMSLVALQLGILTPNRTIYCDGVYEVDSRGRYTQKCHAHPTPYNVSIAIQHSCNSYYYQTFRELIDHYGYSTPGIGLDTLDSYLSEFGLGTRLGLDFPIESKGFLPSRKVYDYMYKHVRNGWRSTYILSLGIGQGELQLTTLQMANLATIIANRGYYYPPHLIKRINGSLSELDDMYKEKKHVRIDDEHFDPVIEGMARVTTVGTGQLARVSGIEVCGKTGTSQNPHGKDHSVFFAFAPRENPKIAIAVYVENAGFGGQYAAPIAGLMIEKYLKDSISINKKYLEDNLIKSAQNQY